MKISDRLIEAFLWIWELVFLCMALPFVLGLSWLIVGLINDVLDRAYHTAFDHSNIYYGISIIVGVYLKIRLTNKRKRLQLRRDSVLL